MEKSEAGEPVLYSMVKTNQMHVGGSRVVFSEISHVIDLGRIGVEFENGQVMQSNDGVKQSKDQVKSDLGVRCMSGFF